MRKLIFAVVFGLQAVALKAQDSGEKPYLVKTFSPEAIHALKVTTAGGFIKVYGQASGPARVEVYIRPSGNRLGEDGIEGRMKKYYTLKVDMSNDTLFADVNSNPDGNDGNGLSIAFRVYVPQTINSRLTTAGGDIDLADLKGHQNFATSGGALHLDHLTGNIDGATSGGSIYAKNCVEAVDLATSGGSIYAEHCEGKVDLATSGGNVIFAALKGEVRASTSGGNVKGDDVTGTLEASTSGGNVVLNRMSCSLIAATSGGNIDLKVVNPGNYIRVTDNSGTIRVELPKDKGMTLAVTGFHVYPDEMQNFHGNVDTQNITGEVNGGGVAVNVEGNGSGNVHVAIK